MIALNCGSRRGPLCTGEQLQKLISVADSYPHERELQESAARAEYSVGSTYMFREGSQEPPEWFDAAIRRAGNDSLIRKGWPSTIAEL